MRKRFRIYRITRTCNGKRLGDLDVTARSRRDAIQVAAHATHVECQMTARRLWGAGFLVWLGLMEFRTRANVGALN
jgi:hypothetical protein